MKRYLIISCEHAVNTVPKAYSELFLGQDEALNSHRGIDFGALEVAQHFSQAFNCDFTQATVTRLLIDCNRSLNNPQCFSEMTSPLPADIKQSIIDEYYLPFRQETHRLIEKAVARGEQVLHLSIHSFTPVLNEQVRQTEIGFLYDPQRPAEKNWASAWKNKLNEDHQAYRVRMNYPYLGTSDGHTFALRKVFDDNCYAGLEIEMNQALMMERAPRQALTMALTSSLQSLLNI